MKPRTPSNPNPTPPDPRNLVALRLEAEWKEQARRKQRASTWQTFLIGGFAVASVFAYLELSRPDPTPPAASATTASDGKPRHIVIKQTPVRRSPEQSPQSPPVTTLTPPSAQTGNPIFPPPANDPRETEETATAALTLDTETPLLLHGPDCERQPALDRDRELLAQVVDARAWQTYHAFLERSILAATDAVAQGEAPRRHDAVFQTPPLDRALLRWSLIGRLGPSEIAARITERYHAAMFLWLLDQPAAMDEFLATILPQDDAGKALQFLMDAWSVNEEKFEKYFSLATACAVVFDRNIPIPNPLGESEYGAETNVDPLKRYLWFIEKNEAGKLVAPVHRSHARDLVWVVCAPVATSELEWAISRVNHSRRNWGNAYGSVRYLMERAVEGFNPYEEYSFKEILRHGGICGDQSYFCVNTARANGIPAMILTGETDLGGHAWAGLKNQPDEWTTTTGRIGGVSKGQADHPQTGSTITEQEILHWNDRHLRSPSTSLTVRRHLRLADFFANANRDETADEIIRLAHQLGRTFPETWRALYALLERETSLTGDPPAPSNLEDWKSFATAMRREFKDNPRMAALAADAEMEYIFPYADDGTVARNLMRERRRIERESGEQTDLIADSLRRQADLITTRGGPDATRDISRLYDRALRDYGGSITGFKMMAEDYFSRMRHDQTLARKAARDIELAFKRVVETGTKDWFRAQTESSIYRMICGYYRAAGDEDRATMLEKRYETLLRRARRSAI
jgi:hypothetical protein